MDSAKYIGLDVHKESISIAVLNAAGKVVMECVVETKAFTLLQFLRGVRGELHATLGNLGGLAIRFAPATRHRDRRVQSAPECLAELRQQKRSH
jgi:hypothetical protein